MGNANLIVCTSCGKEIAKTARTCPHCGAPNKPQKKKHPVLGTIFVLLGIMLVGNALNSNSATPKKAETKSAVTTSEPVAETKRELFNVGDRVQLGDFYVTLNKVNTSNGSMLFTPGEGKQYVTVEFEIENGSSKDVTVSTLNWFKAFFDDYVTNISVQAVTQDGRIPLLDGEVPAGKKKVGVVGYEVPSDWKQLEIEVSPTSWRGQPAVFTAAHK